jgi:hypothetical protein
MSDDTVMREKPANHRLAHRAARPPRRPDRAIASVEGPDRFHRVEDHVELALPPRAAGHEDDVVDPALGEVATAVGERLCCLALPRRLLRVTSMSWGSLLEIELGPADRHVLSAHGGQCSRGAEPWSRPSTAKIPRVGCTNRPIRSAPYSMSMKLAGASVELAGWGSPGPGPRLGDVNWRLRFPRGQPGCPPSP